MRNHNNQLTRLVSGSVIASGVLLVGAACNEKVDHPDSAPTHTSQVGDQITSSDLEAFNRGLTQGRVGIKAVNRVAQQDASIREGIVNGQTKEAIVSGGFRDITLDPSSNQDGSKMTVKRTFGNFTFDMMAEVTYVNPDETLFDDTVSPREMRQFLSSPETKVVNAAFSYREDRDYDGKAELQCGWEASIADTNVTASSEARCKPSIFDGDKVALDQLTDYIDIP